MKADLLIFDGRHLLWRTTDAFSDLSAEVDGQEFPTGGIYGFLNVALRIHGKYGGSVAVAWEGVENFRLGLYPQYKSRHVERSAMEQETIAEMAEQERHLMKVLTAMGVPQYRGVRCEADDVIGTLAVAGARAGKQVIIYTGDSDLRQLVSERISVVSPGHRADKLYDEAAVREKHGVGPLLLAQLKALSGDHSDNIPGVRGVGPVTAALLLNHYGSLKKVLRAALRRDPEWPSTERFRELIRSSVDDVLLYYKLTNIKTTAEMEEIRGEKRQADVVKLLRVYRFVSLASPNELHGLMSMGTQK